MTSATGNQAIRDVAARVLDACRARRLKVASAESCTGGLVAVALTEIPGSSDVFDLGFVTYSNAAKQRMLGVAAVILERHGAVSRQTAEAMAEGALAVSKADLAVAVTGIAGPGGGSPNKPVGLVHLAAAARDGERLHREKHYGDIGRSGVRQAAVAEALTMLELLAAATGDAGGLSPT
jgi:nicotinamide-nucleotide amidase